MAKKPNIPSRSPSAVPAATPVRNTSIPKSQPSSGGNKSVSREQIARRAYEISQSPQCGSEFDNWIRAERELNGR